MDVNKLIRDTRTATPKPTSIVTGDLETATVLPTSEPEIVEEAAPEAPAKEEK